MIVIINALFCGLKTANLFLIIRNELKDNPFEIYEVYTLKTSAFHLNTKKRMFQFFSFHFKTFTKLYLFRTRNNKDSEQSTRKFVPLYFSLILLVEGKFCLCNIFFCCFICVIFCLCKCSFMLLLCFD